eukprot:GSA25T00008039001.1
MAFCLRQSTTTSTTTILYAGGARPDQEAVNDFLQSDEATEAIHRALAEAVKHFGLSIELQAHHIVQLTVRGNDPHRVDYDDPEDDKNFIGLVHFVLRLPSAEAAALSQYLNVNLTNTASTSVFTDILGEKLSAEFLVAATDFFAIRAAHADGSRIVSLEVAGVAVEDIEVDVGFPVFKFEEKAWYHLGCPYIPEAERRVALNSTNQILADMVKFGGDEVTGKGGIRGLFLRCAEAGDEGIPGNFLPQSGFFRVELEATDSEQYIPPPDPEVGNATAEQYTLRYRHEYRDGTVSNFEGATYRLDTGERLFFLAELQSLATATDLSRYDRLVLEHPTRAHGATSESQNLTAFLGWRGGVMERDPANDGKRCPYAGIITTGDDGHARTFRLEGDVVTEAVCRQKCEDNGDCVAFSVNWNEKWCIGCKESLSGASGGTIAYRKKRHPHDRYFRRDYALDGKACGSDDKGVELRLAGA